MSDNTYNIGNSVYKFSFSLAKLTSSSELESIVLSIACLNIFL